MVRAASLDLPAQAVKYIKRLEELVEAPVALLSTSPDRDDTILTARSPTISLSMTDGRLARRRIRAAPDERAGSERGIAQHP